jgi:RES domain-containing protein
MAAAFARRSLSAEGSRRLGGRWHPPGVAVLYTASTEALAYLERFVHLGPELQASPHVMLTISVPDDQGIESIDRAHLPKRWMAVPIPPAVQAVGGQWVQHGRSLALSVPSVLSGSDRNILLNPVHSGYSAVRVLERRAFLYDPRMWKRR